MKKLIAMLAIAAAPIFGFAGIAHADDTRWDIPSADGLIHLPDGTCYQPMSNPPLHAQCDTTRATTPYVAGERFADDPPSTLVANVATVAAKQAPRRTVKNDTPVPVEIGTPLVLTFGDALVDF